jgi:hypothetical protein
MTWGLPPEVAVDARRLAMCVTSYVGQSLGDALPQPSQLFSSFCADYVASLNLFLVAADVWLERRAIANDRLGIGDVFLFFIDIEPWLRVVLDDDENPRLDPHVLLLQLCWDTQNGFAPVPAGTFPRNGAYLRWALLKVLLLIDALRGSYVQPAARPSIQPLGEAFPPTVVEAFDRLRDWFQLKKHVSVIPLTR